MAETQRPPADTPQQGPYDARGFCATLRRGDTQSMQCDDIEALTPLVKQPGLAWVDYTVEDVRRDAAPTAAKLGFSEPLVAKLLENARSGYEDLDTEMGLLLPMIHVSGFEVTLYPLLILLRRGLILTLHTQEAKRFHHIRRYAETYLRGLPKNMEQVDKLTLILLRIIDESNSQDFERLQEIEETADKLSEDLSNVKAPRTLLGNRIYRMKHALIVYLSGLWATADALSELRYGDAALIANDQRVLTRISLLVEQVHSQISMAEHLSDVLASGLEVLQSIYNNQLQILNNRLAMLVGYLTIIGTALLVPNTIATVMSQTNIFTFGPGDLWWYLTMLAVSTVVATVLSWWAVKRMGLLPERPDEG